MAKKVSGTKRTTPAKKKALGKATKKTIEPPAKAKIKRKPVKVAAAKKTKPAPAKKTLRTEKKPLAVKATEKKKEVAGGVIGKPVKKLSGRAEEKKILPEGIRKKEKATGRKKIERKKLLIKAVVKKEKDKSEKKTEKTPGKKPKISTSATKRKPAPEKEKKVVKKIKEKPEGNVLRQKRSAGKPAKTVGAKAGAKKVKITSEKEEKPKPGKVEKIARPRKKTGVGTGGKVDKRAVKDLQEVRKAERVKQKQVTKVSEKGHEAEGIRELSRGKKAGTFPPGEDVQGGEDEVKKKEQAVQPLQPVRQEYYPPVPHEILPAEYGENEITIMIVEPRKLFLFWEVREGTLRIFPGDLHVRVYDCTDNDFQNIGAKFYFDLAVSERIGSLYFDALPAHEYIADIGIIYEGIFITIARSQKVVTPRGAVPDKGILAPELAMEEPRVGY